MDFALEYAGPQPRGRGVIKGRTMKTILVALLFTLAGAALAGPEPGRTEAFKSDYFPLERNLAVDIDAPGAVRAEILISIPSLKEELRYELRADEHGIIGGVYIPPGEAQVGVIAFDQRGEAIYKGEGALLVDEKLTREVRVRLEGRESKWPLDARFGTYLLTAGYGAGYDGGLMLQVSLLDAFGKHLPFSPEEIEWQLPEEFPVLPYSCFDNSLCILEWKPTREQEAIYLCYRDITCMSKKPPDTRGPYRYVAVGRNHSCALTVANDIRCWGDNRYGQLRTTPAACTAATWPSDCSTVPLPVQCATGEACKFQALTAGGERTCAVDTDGRAWCWGSLSDHATGDPIALSYADRSNAEVEAFTGNNVVVRFTTIDTDLRSTCAISTTQALYCWEDNVWLLDDAYIRSPGTRYQSVSVGKRHVCAVQVGGKFECWGDNFDGQLNGTHTGSSGVLHPGLHEILTRGGHRPAAGATSTCAQDPDDNTVCWGSPSHNVSPSSATGGFIALRHSYATSLASNTDSCNVSGFIMACTRICLSGLGGDLHCGNWRSGAPAPTLSMLPDPASDHVISWTQVDVGPQHVCAVTTQRDIWCFGFNTFGQLGTGTLSSSRTTQPVIATNR
jgi:hypothetical protein